MESRGRRARQATPWTPAPADTLSAWKGDLLPVLTFAVHSFRILEEKNISKIDFPPFPLLLSSLPGCAQDHQKLRSVHLKVYNHEMYHSLHMKSAP